MNFNKNEQLVTILRVLWITTELTPYAKVGGLADVSTSLPKALKQLDIDIRIVLPYYDFISSQDYEIRDLNIVYPDPLGNDIQVFHTSLLHSTVPIYLLKHVEFTGQSAYGEILGDEVNLAKRFAIYSWAAYHLPEYLDWTPEILHANDWHTGPVMTFNHKSGKYKTVFTIHNLAYQGSMVPKYLVQLGIEMNEIAEYIDPGEPEDTVRYLRLGLHHTDQITTVSRTYAKEIQTHEYGYGLEVDLSQHPKPIIGVVHGIDLDEWDPEDDEFISENYSIDHIEAKVRNKTYLQEYAGLMVDPNRFTIGVVSRLVYQKGINLLVDIIPQLIDAGIEIFILGTGDPELEDRLRALKAEYPDDIGLFLKYNFTLSHQVIASVDGFIIPSRYEPCGLTQLYSMKYGTVPIVRNTGGLADTVSEDPEKQTGFLFDNFDSDELYEAIIRAAEVYHTDKTRWNRIQMNGMIQDLSWEHRAQNWVDVYRQLLAEDR